MPVLQPGWRRTATATPTATATARSASLTHTRTDPITSALDRTTTEPLGWAPPRPTPADLARQVRDVVADLPRFLTAPLLPGLAPPLGRQLGGGR